MSGLVIHKLSVAVGEKPILHDVSLMVRPGEIHVLMGPNGAGKSTLVNALVGKPGYTVSAGTVTLDGDYLLSLSADERARKGLFLSFQEPVEISGLNMKTFLLTALDARRPEHLPIGEFLHLLREALLKVGLPTTFMQRDLNVGFSGGEKKRFEMLQLLLLKPAIALLDEIDSGLDVEAQQIVVQTIKSLLPSTGVLLISHNPALLGQLPDIHVHVLQGGRFVCEGGISLVRQISLHGFDGISSKG